jgi:hypothetical protein
VLDLYACRWQGQPLWADEYVLSADEKTSIHSGAAPTAADTPTGTESSRAGSA